MNTSAKMIIVLAVITTVSGGILAAWDSITQPKITENRLAEIRAAVGDVLPEFDHYDEIESNGNTFYVGKDGVGNTVGVAFRAAGSGFQGEIAMMVGVTPDFDEITIDTDPSNRENPDWFTEQFQGVPTTSDITALKNEQPDQPDEVQAITGATISSRAVVDILNSDIEQVKMNYRENIEQEV